VSDEQCRTSPGSRTVSGDRYVTKTE
jgi:hypothetical protein